PSAKIFGTSLLTLLICACQAEQEGPIQLGDDGPKGTSGDPSAPPPVVTSPLATGDTTDGPQVPDEIDTPILDTPTDSEPVATVPMDAGKVETKVTENCASTGVTAVDTTVILPADIIFAVDTSGSMGE